MATSARTLKIPYPDPSGLQKTFLQADYTSGTNLTVASNEAFASDNIAVLGEPGTEKAEARPVSSIVNKDTIGVNSAYNFPHNSGDVLYRAEYNQIELSLNTGSGWSVLNTVDIQWDQRETVYVHQGGIDNTQYRFRFKNSASGNFSEYGPTLTGAGFSENSIGYALREVRSIIRDPDKKVVSDREIIRFFTKAKNIIRARRNDWWFWKKTSEGDITTTASIYKYNLDDISDHLDYIRNIRFRYYNGSIDDTYPVDIITDIEFYDRIRDGLRPTDDYVEVVNIRAPDDLSESGYLWCYPTPMTTNYGSFWIDWYKNEADYTSVSDTTDIPLTELLVDYAVFKCEQIKGNDTKAKAYRQLFYGPPDKAKDRGELGGLALLEQMQNGKGRQIGKPRSLKIFRGRRFVQDVYRGSRSSTDYRRENYW